MRDHVPTVHAGSTTSIWLKLVKPACRTCAEHESTAQTEPYRWCGCKGNGRVASHDGSAKVLVSQLAPSVHCKLCRKKNICSATRELSALQLLQYSDGKGI